MQEERVVQTVLGPLPALALGRTTAHEHVFFDLSCYYSRAEDDPTGALGEAPVAPERQWWLRSHPMNCRANLIQQDLEVAVAEVGQFRAAGGETIVDVTTVGIAPNPVGLAEVSRRTGVQIVAGTGFYIGGSYERVVPEMSVEELADHMRQELLEGIAGTAVRAGLIGELGVGDPPTEMERRVLVAAGRVQGEVGCAVSLHPGWGSDPVQSALGVARLALEVGLNPRRTAICHLDVRFRDEMAPYREVGREGFFLELDTFGRETYYPHVDTQLPSDAERIRTVVGLLQEGLGDQVLVGADICFSNELVRHGGHGYAHVLRTVCPRLERKGVERAALEAILVQSPRRWLAGE